MKTYTIADQEFNRTMKSLRLETIRKEKEKAILWNIIIIIGYCHVGKIIHWITWDTEYKMLFTALLVWAIIMNAWIFGSNLKKIFKKGSL